VIDMKAPRHDNSQRLDQIHVHDFCALSRYNGATYVKFQVPGEDGEREYELLEPHALAALRTATTAGFRLMTALSVEQADDLPDDVRRAMDSYRDAVGEDWHVSL